MDFIAFSEQHPSLGTAIVLVLIFIATLIAERIIYRLISNIGNRSDTLLPSSSIFANIARICIWLVGLGVALRVCFNIDITAIVAALGVGGIAISLGFQDTLSNLIGGLQVSLGKLVEPGQYIEVLGQAGRVRDVTWRHTAIVDGSGDEHLIPNSLINKNSLVHLDLWEDAFVSLLLPVGADLEAFSAAVLPALEKVFEGYLASGTVPAVFFEGVQAGGMACVIKVSLLRERMGARVARDLVMRTIDPVIKQVCEQV